jgi:tetratricopeptide (TPR) repeat protein
MPGYVRVLFIALIAIMFSRSDAFGVDNNAKGFFSSGEVKLQSHNYAAAIEDFNKALEVDSQLKLKNRALIYFNRGMAKRGAGNSEGALADFNLALDIWSKYIYAEQTGNERHWEN